MTLREEIKELLEGHSHAYQQGETARATQKRLESQMSKVIDQRMDDVIEDTLQMAGRLSGPTRAFLLVRLGDAYDRKVSG